MEKSQHTAIYRKLVLELKVARVRAGLTQREAAKKLKVYPSFISKAELGERKLDVVELAALCRVYGITVSSLLQEIGLE